jgi:hypothetical protein
MTTIKHDLTYTKYEMGKLYLEAGWYTRGQLEGLLAHLDQLNFMSESYIKEIDAKRPE